MKKKLEFKYTTKFTSSANFSLVENCKSLISNASMGLEDLRKLIPDSGVEKEGNVKAAFNAAVINLVNLNGDAISTDTCLKIHKNFVNQPINIEHDKNNVIGFITNSGFSSFGDVSNLIEEADVSGMTGPFNLALSCLLWEYVDSWAIDFLKMTNDEKSYFFKSISASWEIGFNEYHIVLGSKKIEDAQVISEASEVEKYSKYLRAEGGMGHTPDGTPVYRLIVGEARPLGCAFTSNPAAPVKGIILDQEQVEDLTETPDEMNDSIKNEPIVLENTEVIASNEENLNKNDNLISQSNTKQVINIKSMEYTSLEDFVGKISVAASVAPDSISEFIQSQLKAGDDKFAQSQAEAKQREDELLASHEELKNSKAEIEAIKAELQEIKEKNEQIEKQNRFDSRLDSLAAEYNLDDKTRKVLAKHIFELDDESYNAWLSEDGEVILASKKIVETPKVEAAETTEEAIKKAVATVVVIPNTISDNTQEKRIATWTVGEDVKFEH
jgi:hypothetical protein